MFLYESKEKNKFTGKVIEEQLDSPLLGEQSNCSIKQISGKSGFS